MNSFQKSLDKYLTTEPDDGFYSWAEQVDNLFSEEFFNKNEDWIIKHDGQCNEWMNKLFYKKSKSPKLASEIIQRAFNIYINQKQKK